MEVNKLFQYILLLLNSSKTNNKKKTLSRISLNCPLFTTLPKPDTNCRKKETLYKIKLITSLLLTYSAPKFESNCSRNNIWKLLFNIDNRENKNVSINETENSTN